MNSSDPAATIFRVQRLAHKAFFFEDVAESLLNKVVVVVEGAAEHVSGAMAELLPRC